MYITELRGKGYVAFPFFFTSGMVSNPFPPQEVATKSGGKGFFGLFLASGIVPEIVPEIGDPGLPG